ncbi:MAG: hypothetical protein JWQ09_1809 [Segetibacter sp.]|nr:hypothetical protein [Segetibacter sp.]
MVNPDTQQVFALSDYFGKLANILGEYIDFNKGNTSADERNCLYDAEIELARLAGEINIIGVNLVFQDVQTMLTQLEKITEEVKKAVKRAIAVQDAINIAAGLVTIGTAIISRDPKAIVQSAVDLGKSLKIKT